MDISKLSFLNITYFSLIENYIESNYYTISIELRDIIAKLVLDSLSNNNNIY
jgi:hypothetical protein